VLKCLEPDLNESNGALTSQAQIFKWAKELSLIFLNESSVNVSLLENRVSKNALKELDVGRKANHLVLFQFEFQIFNCG
jgi:hypothetical protein